jgi:transketolase
MPKIDMRDAFFERLVEVARQDDRIIVLSADHGAFALEKFQEEMPERYINMGIAEQNMVGVAAGLAASGKIVFIYGITPFVSLRVLEQLTLDVAAMQLSVNVISVGAGFTYSTDGPTHQGLQDIAAVSTIPGMTILNSSDPTNTRAFVDLAIETEKPHYIRIEKEKLEIFERDNDPEDFIADGYSIIKKNDSALIIIATGLMSHQALEVAKFIESKYSLLITVIDLHQIRPINHKIVKEIMGSKRIIVLEEAYQSTISNDIKSLVYSINQGIQINSIDVGFRFNFESDTRLKMFKNVGISTEQIIDFILSLPDVDIK